MHIEILAHKPTGYEVRIVDADGRTVKTFIYPSI